MGRYHKMVYRGVERKRSGTGIKNVSLNWKLSLIFFFFYVGYLVI